MKGFFLFNFPGFLQDMFLLFLELCRPIQKTRMRFFDALCDLIRIQDLPSHAAFLSLPSFQLPQAEQSDPLSIFSWPHFPQVPSLMGTSYGFTSEGFHSGSGGANMSGCLNFSPMASVYHGEKRGC
jgi:hypothetical protein